MRNSFAIVAISCGIAPAIAAADDDNTPPAPIWIKAVTASSTYAEKTGAYAPELVVAPTTSTDNAGDIRYDSAWCEGKADEGIGESLTINFVNPMEVAKLTIKAGVWKTQGLFDANNVPTRLELTTNDGRTLTVKPPAKRAAVEVVLGGAAVSTLTIKIAAVKKGKMNDSCITEIAFDGDTAAVGFDAAAASAFPAAAAELWAGLWSPPPGAAACDAKLLAKYADFPFAFAELENTHASAENRRFVRHPRSFKTAAAWEQACKKGTFLANDMRLSAAALEAPGKGKLGLRFDLAETSQRMVMAWRGGRWRLVTFD